MPTDFNARFLATITDALPGLMAYFDRDLICQYANKAFFHWFRRDAGTVLGTPMREILGERLFEANLPHIRGALAGARQEFGRRVEKVDGTIGYTLANYVPDLDADGTIIGFFVLVSDVTSIRLAEQQVMESEARYRLLAHYSSDVVYQLDRDLIRQYVSPTSRELLGFAPEELVGKRSANRAHPDDVPRIAAAFRTLLDGHDDSCCITYQTQHKGGHWVWVEVHLKAVKDPETGITASIVGNMRDISDRKAVELKLEEANQRLVSLASEDALTGLANRRAFTDALAREHRRAWRNRARLGLVVIDVDWFKQFNDCYGHVAGDECLRSVGSAIRQETRDAFDIAARHGGEEFAVLLPDADEDASFAVADRIRNTVNRLKLEHIGSPIRIATISAGAASLAIEQPDADPRILLELADSALYHAKRNGRNRVVAASELTTPARRRLNGRPI